MKRNSHHIILLTISFLALCASIYLFYYMRNYISKSINVSKIPAPASSNLDDKSIITAYDSTKDMRQELRQFYLPANNEVFFIESLEKLSKESGGEIDISNIASEQSKGEKSDQFGNATAELSAHGSWQYVMKVLSMAETVPFKSTINNVRLDSSIVGSGKDMHREWKIGFTISAPLIQDITVK